MINLYQIYLNENRKLLKENLGREMKHARKVLKSAGYSDEDAKQLVERWETKPCFRKSNGRFMKGYARLFVNHQITDGEIDKKSKEIESIIDLINRKYSDAFTTGLESVSDGHAWTADELIQKFGEEVKQDQLDSIENSTNKGVTTNKDYEFVRIPNFSDAQEYQAYTSWCITQAASNYNNYTDDGQGIFIFCLKNGFEHIERIEGENCPLDEYGLSMIAISVTVDGSLNTCTCRWNHNNGGNDQIMDVEEIESFFGVNFYETFYPRTEDEYFDDEHELTSEEIDDMIYGDCVYLENGFKLQQSYEDVGMNGELRSEQDAVYGLTYDGENVSDFEYYKNSAHEIGNGYVILKGVGGADLYDIYTTDSDNYLKSIYVWETTWYDEYIVGSYKLRNKFVLFSLDLNENEIWEGKDRFGRAITVPNGTRFEFLEEMSQDLSSEARNPNLYYIIDDGNGSYSIADVSYGNIICLNEKLKLPDNLENISELMPFLDEENDIYYFETVDGKKINAETGENLSLNQKENEVHLLKRFDTFSMYFFKPKDRYADANDMTVDIWYNDKWVFATMGITIPFKTALKRIEPLFTNFIVYTEKTANYSEDSIIRIIDLNTCKQILPTLTRISFTNINGWGYGLSQSTPYEHYIFNNECQLLFPKIIKRQDFQIASYSFVVFETNPNAGYIMSWKKNIIDDIKAEMPFIINQNRPFDINNKLKVVSNWTILTGFDMNGVPIQYKIGENEIKERQEEQYKIDFFNILSKL